MASDDMLLLPARSASGGGYPPPLPANPAPVPRRGSHRCWPKDAERRRSGPALGACLGGSTERLVDRLAADTHWARGNRVLSGRCPVQVSDPGVALVGCFPIRHRTARRWHHRRPGSSSRGPAARATVNKARRHSRQCRSTNASEFRLANEKRIGLKAGSERQPELRRHDCPGRTSTRPLERAMWAECQSSAVAGSSRVSTTCRASS